MNPLLLLSHARYGRLEQLQHLVEVEGYSVDSASEGYTALHLAILRRHPDVIEYLLSQGANVLKRAHDDGLSALERAQASGGPLLDLFSTYLTQSECDICLEDGILYALPCGHSFCLDCTRQWFERLISTNEELTCLSKCCTGTQPRGQDLDVIVNNTIASQFYSHQIHRCLEATEGFVYCPYPTCESGGFLEDWSGFPGGECTNVTCADCVFVFCKDCKSPAHDGHTCEWALWYYGEEKKSVDWIVDNCKACPRCSVKITRDGGCSHITCSKCKYQFCWYCLDKYQSGNYTFENLEVTGNLCPCKKKARAS